MSETGSLPISLVAHTVFCPRRAWLEAQGERVDSAQMEIGTLAHRRVDDPGSSRPDQVRSVSVHHDDLGLVGRCDLIRTPDDDGVSVVEFKAAPVRRQPTVTEPQRIQLALQAICLESAGEIVDNISVYFTNHHVEVDVELDDALRDAAAGWVAETLRIVRAPTAPPPLVDDPRCRSCSHVSLCLPDENRMVAHPRSISVADPDGEILHVSTPGSRVSLRSGRLRIVRGDETLGSVPLERVRGLVIHGNGDVSAAAIRELLWRRLSVVWCSGRGRVVGWAVSAESPNGQSRVQQHVLAAAGNSAVAAEFVAAKINNQATFLRRNGRPGATLMSLRSLRRKVQRATSLPDVFALEGQAASEYFAAFPTMLKGPETSLFLVGWPGRHGRAATDPLNVALNFCYGLLLADTVRALAACGLDPHAGFLHSPGRNKPAAALDLMEEFRAPVVDSCVVGAINNGEVKVSDFTMRLGDCRLLDGGRSALIHAYERRIQTEITHPVFGYRATWRRTIEVQARMLLGWLDGTQPTYRGMVIR